MRFRDSDGAISMRITAVHYAFHRNTHYQVAVPRTHEVIINPLISTKERTIKYLTASSLISISDHHYWHILPWMEFCLDP